MSDGSWTVERVAAIERIRAKLERERGGPRAEVREVVREVDIDMPANWISFAQRWLPLPESVERPLFELVESFIDSTPWHGVVLRAHSVEAGRKARDEGYTRQDRAWWAELLGFIRRDGLNPDKGVQLDPELPPFIRRVGALVAPPMSQRRSAGFIVDLLEAIVPTLHTFGTEKVRQVLRAKD
jgi:hypothetical protein